MQICQVMYLISELVSNERVQLSGNEDVLTPFRRNYPRVLFYLDCLVTEQIV